MKKNFQFKTVCVSNTAYITQLKRQKSKNVLLLLQNIAIMSTFSCTFFTLAVLVVWCRLCRHYRLF